jgi:hypothetical protein
MVIATGAGTVRTAVIDSRETTEDRVERLRTVFRKDGWLPEACTLSALPIPALDTIDTQLALARGAALTTVDPVVTGSSQPRRRRSSPGG